MKFIRPLLLTFFSISINLQASLIEKLSDMPLDEMKEKFAPIIQYLDCKNAIYQKKWTNLLEQKNFSEDESEKEYIKHYNAQCEEYLTAIHSYEKQLPDRYLFDIESKDLSPIGLNSRTKFLGALTNDSKYIKEYKKIYNKMSILTLKLEEKERRDMVKHLKNVQEGFKLKLDAIEKLKNLGRNFDLHILFELTHTIIPHYLKKNNIKSWSIDSVENNSTIIINPLSLNDEDITNCEQEDKMNCLLDSSKKLLYTSLAEIEKHNLSHPILSLLEYKNYIN